MNIRLKLDLRGVADLDGLHARLAQLFGFPSFYGKNYPALVDCLSSLRYPDDGMTQVALKSSSEAVELQVKGLSSCAADISLTLLSAVEAINDRLIQRKLEPSIYLLLVRDS